MLTMNKKMSEIYSKILLENNTLDPALLEIAESGFLLQEGCIFIEKCINIETNTSINDFPDKTGYECFINSINIDDYVACNFLPQGVMFVRKIFSLWRKLKKKQKLVAILSLDELSLKVKFHMQRTGEQWLSDELEDYEEAIMLVDSSNSP